MGETKRFLYDVVLMLCGCLVFCCFVVSESLSSRIFAGIGLFSALMMAIIVTGKLIIKKIRDDREKRWNMTEKNEVELMIEMSETVRDELIYEANTRPGNGPEFEERLREAAREIEKGVTIMKDVLKMFWGSDIRSDEKPDEKPS